MSSMTGTPFDLEGARAWLASGKLECSPLQASGLMQSQAYSLNCEARYLRSIGMDTMSGVHFRFAGRNLRLTVADILKKVEGVRHAEE